MNPLKREVLPPPRHRPESPDLRFGRQIDRLESPPSSGSAAKLTHPFQLKDASVKTPTPIAKINISYGTLNDVVPTNIGTDITVADSTTLEFYLHVTVDLNGALVSVALETGSSQPADGDYDGYITLGEAISGTGVINTINQAATHSLRYTVCGRVVTDGALTTAGTFQFWGF